MPLGTVYNEKLMRNTETSLYHETNGSVALPLTSEPIKSHYVQYLQHSLLMVSVFSHIQRMCHLMFGRGLKAKNHEPCFACCLWLIVTVLLWTAAGNTSGLSYLPLAHLGGALLMEGGSGVEVLFNWDIYCSLLLAISFCCWKNLLVTALSCCSLTVWMASCIVWCTMAISGRGEYTDLTVRLLDSGDDGLEVSLLLDFIHY